MKKTIQYILLFTLGLNELQIFAQFGPPPPPPPPGLPIDGGVLFLAASAVIYGATKLKK